MIRASSRLWPFARSCTPPSFASNPPAGVRHARAAIEPLYEAARRERKSTMEPFHVMFPEDEIFLCGMVLLYGVILGAVSRLLYQLVRPERRTS